MDERYGLIPTFLRFARWWSAHRNGRLFVIAIALPLVATSLLPSGEWILMQMGITVNESVFGWAIVAWVAIALVSLGVILPFAIWRSVRDASKNKPS